jgi:hypothetical protein
MLKSIKPKTLRERPSLTAPNSNLVNIDQATLLLIDFVRSHQCPITTLPVPPRIFIATRRPTFYSSFPEHVS